MTDKKIIYKEEPPVKVESTDVSDGTKPIRLWDFLRVIEPSRAYLAIKRRYGGLIYEGMVPAYGDPRDRLQSHREETKMIDPKNLKPFHYELFPRGRKPKKPAKQDVSNLKGADAKPIAVIVEEASHD